MLKFKDYLTHICSKYLKRKVAFLTATFPTFITRHYTDEEVENINKLYDVIAAGRRHSRFGEIYSISNPNEFVDVWISNHRFLNGHLSNDSLALLNDFLAFVARANEDQWDSSMGRLVSLC
jgi:hypothetical protein